MKKTVAILLQLLTIITVIVTIINRKHDIIYASRNTHFPYYRRIILLYSAADQVNSIRINKC